MARMVSVETILESASSAAPDPSACAMISCRIKPLGYQEAGDVNAGPAERMHIATAAEYQPRKKPGYCNVGQSTHSFGNAWFDPDLDLAYPGNGDRASPASDALYGSARCSKFP